MIELRTDLEQIADLLEAKPEDGPGRLDLTNGEAWPEFAFDNDDNLDHDEDDDRWLVIWPEGSREGYRDMQLFAQTRDDPALCRELLDALDRPSPFRRFKHALADLPAERAQWQDFSTHRRKGRARVWLANAGYRALPR